MAINTGKVVAGGLASGVVLAVLDFVVNGLLLAGQNRAALEALNPALVATMERPVTLAAFIVIDLLIGVLMVWTYAAMRPRFGPGPRTAVLAAGQLWAFAILVYGAMTFMGMWSWGYFFTIAVAFLVMLIAAGLVGGRVYQEPA